MFKNIRFIAAAYCLLMFALVLWPYRFSLPTSLVQCEICPNGAARASANGGVDFREPGMVRSVSAPTGLHQRLIAGSGLTVEAWLTTTTLNQAGPARILSYSQDPYSRNFTLGQENDSLVFRLRTTKTDLNGKRAQIVVSKVFIPASRQHLVVTYDLSRYRVYVDGHLLRDAQGPGGTFANWDRDHRLMIGNERTGSRPWIGKLEGFVLYERALSQSEVVESHNSGGLISGRPGVVAYFDLSNGEGNLFHDESGVDRPTLLELPETFTHERDAAVFSPAMRNTADFVSNFLIFLPFGLLLFLSLSSSFGTTLRAAAATILAAVLLALFTESLQYFVTDRTSSIYDFASSVAGGLFGCLGAIPLRQFALAA